MACQLARPKVPLETVVFTTGFHSPQVSKKSTIVGLFFLPTWWEISLGSVKEWQPESTTLDSNTDDLLPAETCILKVDPLMCLCYCIKMHILQILESFFFFVWLWKTEQILARNPTISIPEPSTDDDMSLLAEIFFYLQYFIALWFTSIHTIWHEKFSLYSLMQILDFFANDHQDHFCHVEFPVRNCISMFM